MNKLQVVENIGTGQVEGVYRLRRPVRRQTRTGMPFIKMILEDQNCAFPAYLWHPGGLQIPGDLTCVQVQGKMRWRSDGAVADLEQVTVADKQPDEVLRLIPQSLCPLPWLIPSLQTLVESINTFWLQQFVIDVFWDDSIAFPFVACPASLKYHHNYPGGLLRHSLECAQMVSRYQEFSQEEKELAMVAALLHDIGKILTLTPAMRRTSLGATVDHDKLTLEVLSSYLRPYDKNWPKETALLRYLMTWRPANRDPGIPRTPLANAVLAADRVSAGIDGR